METATTVILTSHDLADVERLCKRIIFIDAGKVLYDGPVVDLKLRYAPTRTLDVALADDDLQPGQEELTVGDVAGVIGVTRSPARVQVEFDPAVIPVPDLMTEVLRRYTASDVAIVEADLESVVRQIVEEGGVRQ